jgi:hypothetical protein
MAEPPDCATQDCSNPPCMLRKPHLGASTWSATSSTWPLPTWCTSRRITLSWTRKRTALLSTLVFLGLNGHEIGRDDRWLDDAVLAIATGAMGREEVASLLREIVQAP